MLLRCRPKSRFVLLVVSMALTSLTSLAQLGASTNRIANGKLTWVDFSGPIDSTSTYSATTYWRITYSYRVLSIQGSLVTIDLQVSTLVDGKSWVAPNKRTDELLKHEQGHFDIARIHALKFKKEILSTLLVKDTYQETIKAVFQLYLVDARRMGLEYDEQTNHSRNRVEQAKWNQKLENWLLNP